VETATQNPIVPKKRNTIDVTPHMDSAGTVPLIQSGIPG
jgi:hypothetical protein